VQNEANPVLAKATETTRRGADFRP